MKIHALRDPPAPEMAARLARFESRFTYPLGPGRSFRISHGQDYPRFFRSMGDARCFIAERDGEVIGALGIAIRTVVAPDGTPMQVAYIGDLKVDASARGSFVFLRLAETAMRWARPQVVAGYGIAMSGGKDSTSRLTGRIGIPGFLGVAKIVVLRFKTEASSEQSAQGIACEDGEDLFIELSRGRCFAIGGDPTLRSETAPTWLVAPGNTACGRLEDTRHAKLLIDGDGMEMRSAHLASFAWKTPGAGANLIHAARTRAAKLGFASLFVAVSRHDQAALESALGPVDKVIAPATIYGAGFQGGAEWNINSSEI